MTVRYLALTISVFMVAFSLMANATPCEDKLEELSFDKAVHEYAELAFSAEETPAESPESEILKSALESKGRQLLNLIGDQDQGAVKDVIAKRINELRKKQNGEVTIETAEEIQARQDEARLFGLTFGLDGEVIRPEPFEMGTLSPDGETMLFLWHTDSKSLNASATDFNTGKQILTLNIKDFEAQNIRYGFLNGGAQIYFECTHEKINLTSGKAPSPWSVEVVYRYITDITGGKVHVERRTHQFRGYPRNYRLNISPDAKTLVTVEGKTVTLEDTTTHKKTAMRFKTKGRLNARFDSTSQNILVFEENIPKNGPSRISSINAKTWEKNWSMDAWDINISDDGRYIFAVDLQDPITMQRLLMVDAKTGEILRSANDMLFTSTSGATVSGDGQLIFLSRNDKKVALSTR